MLSVSCTHGRHFYDCLLCAETTEEQVQAELDRLFLLLVFKVSPCLEKLKKSRNFREGFGEMSELGN